MGSSTSIELAHGEQSVGVGSASEGETRAHRRLDSVDKLISTWDDKVRTLRDIWSTSAQQFSTNPFLGSRSYEADKSRGPYSWKSYQHVDSLITAFGSGLASLGILAARDTLGIYAINREEWTIAEHACYRQNYVVVSIYDTLGADVCEYVVNHAGIQVLVLAKDRLANALEAVPKCPALRQLIVMDDITEADRASARETKIEIATFAEILQRGEKTVPVEPAKPDDLCTIMYTSGTTGAPKGVMLTHASMIATIAGGLAILQLNSSDVHISYLPLSHIFERIVQLAIIRFGASIAFYQGVITKILEDLQTVQPTMFAGVPRVYNRFHDKIMANVAKASGIKRWMFHTAFNAKLAAVKVGQDTPTWNRLVLNKVRDAIMGPRCRLMVSGSAPLSSETQDFLRVVFGCPIVQGYGLTETSAASTLQFANDIAPKHVGPPLGCSEVKLVDVPEMNYLTKNADMPQGEVFIRGPNLFKGYYKDEVETKKVLASDGWFATGDIGQWNANGTLSIIDRKKNIFKLAQGEYVAAERIEMAYVESPYIAQCFVYGDSLQISLVAIVVPDGERCVEWLTSGQTLPELYKTKEFRQKLTAEMDQAAKAAKLRGFEVVKVFEIEPELWSVDNQMLTPTFKNKRFALKQRYDENIKRMYSSMPAAAQS